MTEKRKAGRPRTANHDRVRVTIKMDPDLKEWTADKKRSDMVNRLLRLFKGISESIDDEFLNGIGTEASLKGVAPSFATGGIIKAGMIQHVGPDKGEYILSDELLANIKDSTPKITITNKDILKTIIRAKNPPKDKP